MTKEDGLADTIKPRLDKMGANGDNILILKGSKEQSGIDLSKLVFHEKQFEEKPKAEDDQNCQPFDLSQMEVLKEALVQARPRLVIIDNITSYLGPKISMNKAQDVAFLMNEISNLAQRF